MIEFQRLILGDARRNELFAAALKRLIVPGKTTVADLGSGTGFLAFVASRLGAKQCWLYETSELLELSREIAKQNGLENCVFVRAHSLEVGNPPRADVVISETLGNLALEENTLETLQDAPRFLAPGGVMIPQKLEQFVAPVTSARCFDALDIWPRVGPAAGVKLDYSAARRVCFDNVYVRSFKPGDLLPDGDVEKEVGGTRRSARVFDAIDFRRKTSSVRRATVEWKLAKPATIYGFALWWRCALLEGEGAAKPEIALSTAPDAPATHWEQIWLPPAHASGPIAAKAGETLRLAIECDSRPEVKINLKWKTTLLDRAGKSRVATSQDMQKGYLE